MTSTEEWLAGLKSDRYVSREGLDDGDGRYVSREVATLEDAEIVSTGMELPEIPDTITMPDSRDLALESLEGLSILLTAAEWYRAALVCALVGPANGKGNGPGKLYASVHLSVSDMARLGISGLRNRVQITKYRNAWLAYRDVPEWGEEVDLSGLPDWSDRDMELCKDPNYRRPEVKAKATPEAAACFDGENMPRKLAEKADPLSTEEQEELAELEGVIGSGLAELERLGFDPRNMPDSIDDALNEPEDDADEQEQRDQELTVRYLVARPKKADQGNKALADLAEKVEIWTQIAGGEFGGLQGELNQDLVDLVERRLTDALKAVRVLQS